MNKIINLLLSSFIICLLFPIYSLLSVDEVFSNEWSDIIIGNVIFGFILIWGGRWALTFGFVIAFQRILEILVVYIWADGRFSAGITRQLFLHIQTSTLTENFGYFKQMYPQIFMGLIIIILYLLLYGWTINKLLRTRKNNKKLWYKIIKFVIIIYLIIFAWNKKVRTDIFFFENNKDEQLFWLNSANTYPFLTKKTDKKIDIFCFG